MRSTLVTSRLYSSSVYSPVGTMLKKAYQKWT